VIILQSPPVLTRGRAPTRAGTAQCREIGPFCVAACRGRDDSATLVNQARINLMQTQL